MGIVKKILGPNSKYDKTIPYTYEARVKIVEDDDMYTSYQADTVCSLIEYLADNEIEPEMVDLVEIYVDKENSINKEFCLDEDGHWLRRPYICRSLQHHYKGHIDKEGCCAFFDRDQTPWP